MKRPIRRLEVRLDRAAYSPGDTLRGKVIVEVARPCPTRKIEVTLSGRGRWSCSSRKMKVSDLTDGEDHTTRLSAHLAAALDLTRTGKLGRKSDRKCDMRKSASSPQLLGLDERLQAERSGPHDRCETYINQSTVVFGHLPNDTELSTVGSYTFYFKFDLPLDLPASFVYADSVSDGLKCDVQYMVKAVLKKPVLSLSLTPGSLKSQKQFVLLPVPHCSPPCSPCDDHLPPVFTEGAAFHNQLTIAGGHRPVECLVKVDRTKVVIGEQMNITAVVGPCRFARVQARLVRHLSCRGVSGGVPGGVSGGEVVTRTAYVSDAREVVCDVERHGVTTELTLPVHGGLHWSSAEVNNPSALFSVRYDLQVAVSVEQCQVPTLLPPIEVQVVPPRLQPSAYSWSGSASPGDSLYGSLFGCSTSKSSSNQDLTSHLYDSVKQRRRLASMKSTSSASSSGLESRHGTESETSSTSLSSTCGGFESVAAEFDSLMEPRVRAERIKDELLRDKSSRVYDILMSAKSIEIHL